MQRLVFLIVLLSIPAMAQHNNRSGRDLQFRFGNPGARSLSFGGAFIGLADDATAPLANPAGMVRTSVRSAAFELNYNREENEIPFASGHIHQENLFEFNYDFTGSSAPESTFQMPYLSVVIPNGKWRFGIFAHQQANMRREYFNDHVTYCLFRSQGYPDCIDAEGFPTSQEFLNLEMINVGGSLAYAFNDKISFGMSLFYSDFDYQADSILLNEQIVGNATISRFARGEDTDFGGIAGLLFEITPDWSLGITYKKQPEFDYTASLISTREVPRTPADFEQAALFKVPDALGFGISVTPMDQFTFNFDANRVYYSQVTDNFVDFSQIETVNGFITQSMKDVTELHVGMEYVYLGLANPLAIRVGYWLDPYHAATNNVEDSQILDGSVADPEIRDIFFLNLFEKDENHYSFGLGYTFGRKFQLDGAVEVADTSTNATLSGIWRF